MTEVMEELRQRLAETQEALKTLQATADAEKRDMSEDEITQVDALLAEFESVKGQVERREMIEANSAKLEASQGRQVKPETRQDADADDEPERRARKHPAEPVAERGKWGWRSMGEFAISVKNGSRQGGRIDQRLIDHVETRAPTSYANEGTGADGGFAVPPDFRNEIMSIVGGEDSLMGRCDQLTSGGNTLSVPKDEDTPWSTAGIQAYWEGENSQLTQSKPVIEQLNIRLNKLAVLVPVTDELLEDAPAMSTYLKRKVPQKMDFKMNWAVLHGTGVGMPLGLMNAASTVTVAKEGSQVADTVVAENVMKMWSRMYGPSRSNAVWLVNQDVEPQLQQMNVKIKNVAGTENVGGFGVYMPANGLSQSPYATLYGRPIIPTQACETIGDLGDIWFVDFKQYLIAIKTGGVRAEVSIHLWFDYDTTAYRFILRVAGMPWWGAAADPRDGSNTISPYINLEARA